MVNIFFSLWLNLLSKILVVTASYIWKLQSFSHSFTKSYYKTLSFVICEVNLRFWNTFIQYLRRTYFPNVINVIIHSRLPRERTFLRIKWMGVGDKFTFKLVQSNDWAVCFPTRSPICFARHSNLWNIALINSKFPAENPSNWIEEIYSARAKPSPFEVVETNTRCDKKNQD